MSAHSSPPIAEHAVNHEQQPAAPRQTGFLHILLAFDGSEHSVAAIEMLEALHRPAPLAGGALPGGALPMEITALCVMPTQHFDNHQVMQAALDKAEQRLKAQGIAIKTRLQSGNPAPTILGYADEIEADLIMIGAQGLRATLGILLGGVAQQVVEYARQPVLVVRATPAAGRERWARLRQPGNLYRPRILVVVDGSEASQRAVDYLTPPCDLPGGGCRWLPDEAEITLMHVLPPPMAIDVASRAWTLGPEVIYPVPLSLEDQALLDDAERREGEKLLAFGRRQLEQAGHQVYTLLERGDAATQIIERAAALPADLIVCGSRGLNPVTGWLLGSVSRKLVHYSNCSVLIVK